MNRGWTLRCPLRWLFELQAFVSSFQPLTLIEEALPKVLLRFGQKKSDVCVCVQCSTVSCACMFFAFVGLEMDHRVLQSYVNIVNLKYRPALSLFRFSAVCVEFEAAAYQCFGLQCSTVELLSTTLRLPFGNDYSLPVVSVVVHIRSISTRKDCNCGCWLFCNKIAFNYRTGLVLVPLVSLLLWRFWSRGLSLLWHTQHFAFQFSSMKPPSSTTWRLPFGLSYVIPYFWCILGAQCTWRKYVLFKTLQL